CSRSFENPAPGESKSGDHPVCHIENRRQLIAAKLRKSGIIFAFVPFTYRAKWRYLERVSNAFMPTTLITQAKNHHETEQLLLGKVTLRGQIDVPEGATGIVLFAHGSGSSRLSPRNQLVARILRSAGLATLLFDLLSQEEEQIDNKTRHLRFDIKLLAERLMEAATWLES